MKPTLRLYRGFVAATLGLTASLTLPVVFFDNVLLAQTIPTQNVFVSPSIAAPQVASPQIRQQASQKLHLARKAVATRDIASAERFFNEVLAMQLTYQENEDSPEHVQKLIQQYHQITELGQAQGGTEQFRRHYARFNLVQADIMLQRGELDLAWQLTQEAVKQQIQSSQEDKNRGLEPAVMFQRINDARRAQNVNTYVATTQTPQPLSQAAQEQSRQAVLVLQQAREALNAGQFDEAERLVRTAAASNLPEYAFPSGNTPSRLLTEIAARRQGMAVNPQMTVADAQSAIYRPAQDQSQTLQVGNQPTLAPQIPIPGKNTPYIDQTIRNQQAVISQISSDIMQQLANAQNMSQEQRRPDAALEILQNAKLKVEQLPQLDSATKKMYIQQIDRAIEETINFRERYTAQEKQNHTNEAVRAELRHEAEKFRNKEEQLAIMFKDCEKMIKEQRYEEALRIAKKAKEFDPDNPGTQVLLTSTQLAYNLQRSIDIRDEKYEGFLEEMLDIDRRSIVPNFAQSPMQYSSNWNALTKRRNASNQNLQYKRSESERQIIQQLGMPVTLNVNRPIPLEQALQQLCSQVGISPYLDRAALSEVNILTDTMITMPIANEIKLKSALNTVLEQLDLAYVVKNEVLTITSKKKAKGTTYTKPYYVGDLVREIPSAMDVNPMEEAFKRSLQQQIQMPRQTTPNGRYGTPNDLDFPVSQNGIPNPAENDPNILAQRYGGTGGGGYGTGGTGGYGGGTGNRGGGYGGSGGGYGNDMDFSSIIDIIQSVIEPDSWDEGDATIAVHSATQSLAIRQTEEVHAQIEDLLNQVRKMNDLQVAVEVRYITLSDSFYERMGTNFDMIFRNDSAFGRISQVQNTFPNSEGNTASTSHVKGNNVTVGLQTPGNFTLDASIPLQQDSFGIAIPAFGGYNPAAGISTGFALLSDIETYFFISAAQGDRRNSVMEAPKVMLHNGQYGVVNDTTSIPFVTSVNPVVADFAIGYQPIITMLPQGQVLRVQATVSNDRQYVRLTLNPTFTTLVRVDEFKYYGDDQNTEETETTSRGDDTSTTTPSTDPRSNASRRTTRNSGITIQQPVMAQFYVNTTVNCPDGGTVLLGGIKRLSEGRVEAGVPMLNKLPYIQRLFSNTAIGRDTQSVMMMVTPRIIIQEEEEDFIMGGGGRSTP